MGYTAIDKALVDSLVATTNQNGAGTVGQLLRHALIVALACRAHQYNRCRFGVATAGPGGVDGLLQRLGHHDHAGAAAVWPVIHRAMYVVSEIARVPQAQGP